MTSPTIEQALAALEPCPFCGERPVPLSPLKSYEQSANGKVRCENFDCPIGGLTITVTAWDRRAALTASPAAPSDEETGKLKPCTCHPDDNPPKPCPRRYALSECRAAKLLDPAEFEQWFARVREWSGSAWLAGEKVKAGEQERLKGELYGDLCSLGNYLATWADEAHEAAAHLTTQAAEIAQANVVILTLFANSSYATGHGDTLADLIGEYAAQAEAEIARLTARLGEVEEERDKAQALVEHVRESLCDQALARHDPQMPLLASDMLERLENESEAAYALSDDQDDRVYAHALSLLHAWQVQARATAAEAKLAALTAMGEEVAGLTENEIAILILEGRLDYKRGAAACGVTEAGFLAKRLHTAWSRKAASAPDLDALKEAVARLRKLIANVKLAYHRDTQIGPVPYVRGLDDVRKAADAVLAIPALRNALGGGQP